MVQKKNADFYTGLDAERVLTYDAHIRIDIPGYELVHQLVMTSLSSVVPKNGRVLVPGCGTGHEVVLYAQHHPDWQILALDPAQPMLDRARQKVEEAKLSNVEFHLGFVHDLPLEASFHASASLLAMHFIPDDGGKEKFLSDIAARLVPGGLHATLDFYCDDEQQLRKEQVPLVKEWMFDQARLFYPNETANAPEQVAGIIASGIEEQIEQVHHISESRLRELIALAGFDAPICFYTAFYYRGWLARKRG